MILAEQIKEIEKRREALERCLGIEQKRIDLRNEEEKTQEPDFWDNPDKAVCRDPMNCGFMIQIIYEQYLLRL